MLRSETFQTTLVYEWILLEQWHKSDWEHPGMTRTTSILSSSSKMQKTFMIVTQRQLDKTIESKRLKGRRDAQKVFRDFFGEYPNTRLHDVRTTSRARSWLHAFASEKFRLSKVSNPISVLHLGSANPVTFTAHFSWPLPTYIPPSQFRDSSHRYFEGKCLYVYIRC